MSQAILKLRGWLPGQQSHSAASTQQRHSMSLEPEIGFQITLEATQQQPVQVQNASSGSGGDIHPPVRVSYHGQTPQTIPELNVQLIAARHLPASFGFKSVLGYMIKVKLFPGSKRLNSSIQTNSWPKFNENFKFPLASEIRPSIKQTNRRDSKCEFTPDDLFTGQFVVFTAYALLELPPANFNHLSKTYRSLREKSATLIQKVVENTTNRTNDDREDGTSKSSKTSRKTVNNQNPRSEMPPLTVSEARRNIGSVTCYLESKLFKKNPRTGVYCTEEMWFPIKDINTSVIKTNTENNVALAAKGLVELELQLRRSTATNEETKDEEVPPGDFPSDLKVILTSKGKSKIEPNAANSDIKVRTQPWNRLISLRKQKDKQLHENMLYVTTTRMRCSSRVKDELECAAGTVYLKTSVFEHGIYIDSWKSSSFYPSLSTKWDAENDQSTIMVPLLNVDSLDNIQIRTTLGTKTRMGKKLTLGTVVVGVGSSGSGIEHMRELRNSPLGGRVSMWHNYQ